MVLVSSSLRCARHAAARWYEICYNGEYMDSSWSAKRRFRIKLAAGFLAVVLIGILLAVLFSHPPTCFDSRKNQEEVGVDCGGTCALMCSTQISEARVAWAQPFRVADGWYSAVAYIEHINKDAYVERVPYRFQFYDSDGVLITERSGYTHLTSDPVNAVFVGRVDTGERAVARVSFSWLEQPRWYRQDRSYRVTLEGQRLVSTPFGNDLMATLHNEEPTLLTDVKVVTILYDSAHNAIAASETYVDQLLPWAPHNVTFSWPGPFVRTPVRIELIPRVPIQQ